MFYTLDKGTGPILRLKATRPVITILNNFFKVNVLYQIVTCQVIMIHQSFSYVWKNNFPPLGSDAINHYYHCKSSKNYFPKSVTIFKSLSKTRSTCLNFEKCLRYFLARFNHHRWLSVNKFKTNTRKAVVLPDFGKGIAAKAKGCWALDKV